VIGRAKVPPPAGPDAARVADLTGRVDQAVQLIDSLLRWHGHNSGAKDALLDVRNLLRPPERPT
jgi:hypothetical protein